MNSWTESEEKKAKTNLSRGRTFACRRVPFLSDMIYVLIPLPAELPPGVGTGVTKEGVMLYNPRVVAQWTVEDCAVAVIHESEHLRRDHNGRRKSRDPERWNLAADAEINDDIAEMRLKLLDSDTMPAHFGMRAGLTAETYYGQPPPGTKKCCGSGAGNKFENEPKIKGLKELKLNKSDRRVQIKAAAQSTEKKMEEAHAMNPGSVPNGMLLTIREQREAAEIPWEKKLQAAVSRAASWRSGFVDTTYSKINRKQAGLGFGEGVPILPAYIEPVPKIALVQDTSASMGTRQIEKTLSEAEEILRVVGGEVLFMSCDTRVHAVKSLSSTKEMVANMRGGGGTDFRPAFSLMEKMPIHERPDIVVFSTDAHGYFPAAKPVWCSVIWLLSGSGFLAPGPTPWGTRIVVKRRT